MLKVEDVSVFIGKNKIIQSTSFQVKKGQVVGLIGPNGAGKTTIMKTILGLTHFTGVISIRGKKVTENDHKILENVGALIEHPAIYPFMTGYQNLKLYGKDNEDIQQLISLLKMDHYIHNQSKKYSLGMKQKLGIAIALLNQPEFVILDEPMNGLDLESTILVRSLIKSYALKGTSFLISSHMLSELEKVITSVILVSEGRVIIDQPMEIFYQNDEKLFNLKTQYNDSVESLFQQKAISYSKVDDRLVISKKDLIASQILLYENGIYLEELSPSHNYFEDRVLSILEKERGV